MAAASISLFAARGEAVTYTCTHQTSAGTTTAIDISGWTITATARDETGAAVLSKTGTVTSGVNGTYTIAVTHADSLLVPRAYRFDIWRTDSGSEKLMGVGTWTITGEVLYP